MGEEVSAHGIGLVAVRQVVDGEGETVFPLLLRVVAQFRFDLAVGIGPGGVLPHQQIGVCRQGISDVGKSRALPQNRIVAVAIAKVLHHGNGCGHQEALPQLAGRQTGFFVKMMFLDVLSHQRRHACHLGEAMEVPDITSYASPPGTTPFTE